jgi:peptide/nickel transport system substrate-binding protein
LPIGPASLVPNAANDGFTLSGVANVYETLVDLDPHLRIRPALAEAWQTADDLTWTFRLRRGVRLHDGRLLEAADVAESLRWARDDPASKRQAELAPVESIEAPDDRTVVLRTHRPYPGLPLRLCLVTVAARGPDGQPVGTGPYRVVSWTPSGDLVLEAFPGYRNPPAIPRVEYRVIPRTADQVQALREGRVQVLVELPVAEMRSLAGAPGVRTVARDGLRVLFLGMDAARRVSPHVPEATNPLRDRRVRRAVAQALDRRALVDGPLGGLAEVVDQIASPLELGGDRAGLPSWGFDPGAARRLLAEAGWSRGFEVVFDFMPTRYRASRAVVDEIVRMLAAVGIRAVRRENTPAEFMGRLEREDTALYLLGWSSDTGDPGLSYEYLLHSRSAGLGLDNGGGYSSPEVDRLIRDASARGGPEERAGVLRRLAEIVHEDAAVVPLYRQSDLYAAAADLEFEPRLDGRVRGAEFRWRRPSPVP